MGRARAGASWRAGLAWALWGVCGGLLAAASVASVAAAQDAPDALRVEVSEPRAYGYQVGELVQRQITVHAPHGWRLVEDSLPRPGGRGGAIELRRIAAQHHAVPGGQRHELTLEYQVLLAPAHVRTLEIAPLALRFEHATRSEDVRIEAWPVTVAPLTPPQVSARRGLGELQPDRPPPLIDTAAPRLRLWVCAGLAVLLLCSVATLTFGPPWRAARNRPFGRAWREMRHLPGNPDAAQWRAACRTLHRALNDCAGEVLFEPGLARFVAAQPRFRGVREGLARFMQLSRNEFFGGAARVQDGGAAEGSGSAGDAGATAANADAAHAGTTGNAAWLVDLCRRCRDAERGLGTTA